MKRLLFGLSTLGLIICSAGVARADLTEFSFSYSGTEAGGNVSGSGFLFGTETGTSGVYLLTSGYGVSSEAGNLTLLVAGTYINNYSPSVDLISDNLLTPNSNQYLDGDGIVFSGSSLPSQPANSNSQYFNIWGNGPNNYTYFNNYDNDSFPFGNGTLSSFTVTDVGTISLASPEPSSFIIAGVGAIGFLIAGAMQCRQRQSAAKRLLAS
jgi:hypothetical protein